MRFEKVTYEAFKKDMETYVTKDEERIKESYGNIEFPTRKTKYSAGYDFVTPLDFTIAPDHKVVIPTGIKVYFDEREAKIWHLSLYVRSSVGIKKDIIMSNGTGVIDGDYYGNKDNDGDMLIALTNIGSHYRHFMAGDRIIQGIFELHGLIQGDTTTEERTGGVGSTDEEGCNKDYCEL